MRKHVVTTILKLELKIALPYLRSISSITKQRLNRCICKHLKLCKLQIIFETGIRLKNYFRFKDYVPETLLFNFAHKFKCGSCRASYYHKITNIWRFRFPNTIVCLLEQVKEAKIDTLSTSVRAHKFNCNHTVAWEYFSIVGRESSHYLLETKESLFT